VNEISFVAGVILMINEIMKTRKELRGLVFSKEKLLDSDEEEHFVDADQKPKKRNKKAKKKQQEEEEESEQEEAPKSKNEYDPSKRDPRFANADKMPFWELHALRNYYHPTIRIWVENLMLGRPIEYTGDPLQDFSMANFLDKMILKPAKSAEKLKRMKFNKRNTRAEEIRGAIKSTMDNEVKNFEEAKQEISKKGQFRPDEEFLYKHLLLKSKNDKLERQKKLEGKESKKPKHEQEKDQQMDALDNEVDDFEMSEEDLPDDFFADEEGLEEVQIEDAHIDKDVFQEAPSDSD
jgi:ribosome biogenesis protein MAK21